MTRRFLYVMVVLSCASRAFGAPDAPRDARRGSIPLTIAVTSGCEASDAMMTIARSEASRIWSRADVDVRWTTVADVPYESDRSGWLVVRCVDGEAAPALDEAPRMMPIAAIRFIGAEPTNTIGVSLANARFLLLHDSREIRDLDRRFTFHKDKRLGRMIGRAIAHEIGHFLGRSAAHTATGLMKARHTVAAFTGDTLHAFTIDRADFAQYVADARERARLDASRLLLSRNVTRVPVR